MTKEDSYDPEKAEPLKNYRNAKKLYEMAEDLDMDNPIRQSLFLRAEHYSSHAIKQFGEKEKYGLALRAVKLARDSAIRGKGKNNVEAEIKLYDYLEERLRHKRYVRIGEYFDKKDKKRESIKQHTPEGDLEIMVSRQVAAVTAIVGLMGAILFMNSSVTGNAVALLNQGSSSIIGMVCLIIALIAAVFYFRKK
jgi:hypothetical protein